MGAPRNNSNALKHGGRSSLPGIVLASLGKKCKRITLDLHCLRRALTHDIESRHGPLDSVRNLRLHTALRIEASCRSVEQAIRDATDLPPAEVCRLRSQINAWSRERDKIIAELLEAPGKSSGKAGDGWVFASGGDNVGNASQPESTPDASEAADATPGPSIDAATQHAQSQSVSGPTAAGGWDELDADLAIPNHAPAPTAAGEQQHSRGENKTLS